MLRKGRNAQIAHRLKFQDEEGLRQHLLGCLGEAGEKDGRIKSAIVFYHFVHRYYGQTARARYQPLALVYLEATGARIVDRDKWIISYRSRNSQQENLWNRSGE